METKFKSSLTASITRDEERFRPKYSARSQEKSTYKPYAAGDAEAPKPQYKDGDTRKKRLVYAAKKESIGHVESGKFGSSLPPFLDETKSIDERDENVPPTKAPFKSSLLMKEEKSPTREEKQDVKPRFKSSLISSMEPKEARPSRNDRNHKQRDVSSERQGRTRLLERQGSGASISSDTKKSSILSRVGSRNSLDEEGRRNRSSSRHKSSEPSRRNDPPPPPQSVQRKVSFESHQRYPSADSRKVVMPTTPNRYESLDDRPTFRARMDARTQSKPTPASDVKKQRQETQLEREKRTNEYYATLNKEVKKEAKPFKSSIMQSMKSDLSSSLALSIAREPTIVEKIRYTLIELRSLNRPDYSRPTDLPDMTVIVIPLSPRSIARASKRSFGVFKPSTLDSSLRRSNSQKATASGSGRGSRESKKGKKSRRGREVPEPVLLDGPFEPLVKSEKRWVPSKEKSVSAPEETAATQVKSLLNKLTRELFEKLTKSFCEIPLSSFSVLRTIIGMIMDKALEEPNFAEVYADLCSRLHTHISKSGPYNFLHPVEHISGEVWYWTAITSHSFPSFQGPYTSVNACVEALDTPSKFVPASEPGVVPRFYCTQTLLLAIIQTKEGEFYVSSKPIDSLTEDELFIGEYNSAEAAMKAAVKGTTFKRLLVTRCQYEFDKWNVTDKIISTPLTEEEKFKANVAAKRIKQRMLGNMRFIGELFKVELLTESAVQTCLLKLLGLRLVTYEGQPTALQAIRMPDEEELEALCKMLATVGKKFDHEGVKTVMNGMIVRIVELSQTQTLPSRTRFLLKDLLETRDYQWVPRRKELQQKTLEEVRKEAEKLQRLGKNAQHDDLVGKRKKLSQTSDKLAKQNSTLLVHVSEPTPLTPEQATNRIKGIIKEYASTLDANETRICLKELSRDLHVEFVETAFGTSLDGKEQERAAAVDMLVALYETLDLGATAIQAALLNILEFLDDLRIDIPMVHEYCAVPIGRLIVVGCFGLSWLQSVVGHLVDSGLAGKLLAEVLSVIEDETSLESVCAMVAREELSVAAFLREGQSVEAYLKDNEIDMYFYEDDDEDSYDDALWQRLQPTVEEYLVVGDLAEVEACLKDLEPSESLHPELIKLVLNMLCDCKANQRPLLVQLLQGLYDRKTLEARDFEHALGWWLTNIYEDVEIDVPQVATYIAPTVSFLLASKGISVEWFASAIASLVESGLAAKLVEAVGIALDTEIGHEAATELLSSISIDSIAPTATEKAKVAGWML
ncbi:eukaryotic translation initiation factor 4 gamma 2 [Thraustotheca clavata]|uniref:Eukaryotic translation initiation factor 4 gamma 2 n=1 Tax=Thraustotheca clavata TaxID=74557 RepID=A0A1W0A0Y8_9STRA|nr:eukaryotic translation initiation factor 4 gamma 2 [Thraustotheca clavata]